MKNDIKSVIMLTLVSFLSALAIYLVWRIV